MKIRAQYKGKKESYKMDKLTFAEFMRIYRPNGTGSIGIMVDGKMDLIDEITEVVCDFCNDEIPPSTCEADKCNGKTRTAGTACDLQENCQHKKQSTIYITGTYAFCQKCFDESYEIVERDPNDLKLKTIKTEGGKQ